jgi:sialic acid synthase SpsE
LKIVGILKIFLISEIGSNWEGNMSTAKKLIRQSKNAGADAVKFQMWRAEDLYPKHQLFKKIKKTELSFKNIQNLKSFSDSIGIEFFCSVFYPEAVDFLEKIGVKRYKIASRTCILKDPLSIETLSAVNQTRKPTIVSMGMGGNKKIIEKSLSKNQVKFLYCISEYPLKINKINWRSAVKHSGFSDHTLGITAPLIFTTLMKFQKERQIIIEKHVKLEHSKSLDASTSIDTEQLKILNQNLRNIEKIKKFF